MSTETEPKPAAAAPRAAAKPKVTLIEIAPAARPAKMLARHWTMVISFFACVLLPVLLTATYLFVFAADQFTSRVGFTVRTEKATSSMDFLGGLAGLTGFSSSSDTDILFRFLQSEELVAAVDKDLDLHQIYSKPAIDPVFSLSQDASIEEMTAYWKSMVRIYYDAGTGLMEVEVRAFEPLDAQNIAKALFSHSTSMINQLSSVAQSDTTRYAKAELDQAIERLTKARQAITLFRNKTQMVDPGADIQGQMGLLNSLQSKLADALIELDLLDQNTSTLDPRVEIANRKIAVIEKRIEEERRKLGVGDGLEDEGYATLITEYESLRLNTEFAEQAYISALSTYDGSVAEALRQTRYLAAYVQPTLAETPLYPHRLTILLVASLLLFGFWTIGVLVLYSLKDRR